MQDRIDKAFQKFPRQLFLPGAMRFLADMDEPLKIGHGQTNSQPSLVRRMLEWLGPRPDDVVLDVGSGSGWTAALLSELVSPGGRVFAVEKIPELVTFGRNNASQAGAERVEFFISGSVLGLPEHAPYDRILVSASAKETPEELVNQLKPGGKMVIPIKNDILEITKKTPEILDVLTHSGFHFVPLK